MRGIEILHKVTARYRKNYFFAEGLRVTGKDLSDKRWIFILGCYNSGTTLLDQILSDHPDISGLPDEGVMLTDRLPRPEDYGWRRMWYKCKEEMEIREYDSARRAKAIKKQWSHFFNLQKSFLLEKSISNTPRIPFFNENFQPSYFIHIVRNGFAVAEGIQRKAEIMENNHLHSSMEVYPIRLCIEQWVESLKTVNSQKKDLSNFIEIKYEDLASNPEEVINGILEFIGLDHFPKNYFSNSFRVHEKESEIVNMNARSLARLKPEEKEIIVDVAGEYLRKYNYL